MQTPPSNINFPKEEESILKFWEKNRTFYKSNENKSSDKRFSFYDGPPFANGLPHYGHILANTVKDTVPRYWNMRGYHVERRFGWDCHGLPVEFEIEKKFGLKGRTDILKMGVSNFNEACRESVLHYTNEWKQTITRIGRWVDWDNQYRTMDLSFMESVWWVFSSLYNKNHVYRGHKIVPYSPRITAVLSNFEANQNYKDVQDPSVFIKFKLKATEEYILAWTTTPWTLVSNLALAVGPNISYVKVKDKESGDILILAKDRLEAVFKGSKKVKSKDLYDFIEDVSVDSLIGLSYEPLFPFFKDHEKSFNILCDSFVTTSDGTGVVHLAPAFGEDDFRICSEAGIELLDPLDESAFFKEEAGEFSGQYIKDADKNIIKALKDQGKLFKQETITHSYPFCERTDQPLIYRAIPAWYIKVEEVRGQLTANNEKINWVPEHLKAGRMGKWLENARDWAVSRNRFWGTPIPIWICNKNDDHRKCLGSVEDLEKLAGSSVSDLHKHKIDHLTFDCSECSGTMERISEVFDCWFESGSMPYSQKHYPFENKKEFEESFPAEFIAEGLDQTRGWFYTLSVLSTFLFKKPAFKNVVVNGMILAADGRKMGKRWRNYTAPEELISQYGADSVRLYMLNSAILRGEDLKFKDEGVKDITRAVILPLWNSYSFLATYAEADGWKPGADLIAGKVPKVTADLDKWLISRFQTLASEVQVEMEAYKLFNVVPKILSFIEDLTNWYIRLNRRRFWGGDTKLSEDSKDAYSTLFYTLNGFVRIFAPFAPFISETIYKNLVSSSGDSEASVHLQEMPMANLECKNENLEHKMALIRTVADLGRSLRAKYQLKVRQALPEMLVITRDEKDKDSIDDFDDILKTELNIKKIEFSTAESNYVNLSVKPNLKTLGRKLGSKLNSVKNYLIKLNESPENVAKLVAEVESKGKALIEGIEVSIEDFLIDRHSKGDREIATQDGVTILLDTKLTPELIEEGLAREFVNRVQKYRKDCDLKVTDRIYLSFEVDSKGDSLKAAVEKYRDYIMEETLSHSLTSSIISDKPLVFTKEMDIEGANCKICIQVKPS